MIETDPAIEANFHKVLEDHTAGDPMRPEVGIYCHSVGTSVHDIGARVAENNPHAFGDRVGYPLALNNWYSIELHTSTTVPEWDYRTLRVQTEEDSILTERGIEFISLTEQIDTTTPGGKLIFHLMGALAEFERDLIRERTNAGLAASKARGRVGGRPRKLKTNGKVALARRMFTEQSHSIPEICMALGISRATLYRYVKETEPPE